MAHITYLISHIQNQNTHIIAIPKFLGKQWFSKSCLLKKNIYKSINLVCMYNWGFRARQHLRSLAPVINDDGQMIFGELRGLKLPDICLTGEEKPRKNLTQETCDDRGLYPGLLRDRCACSAWPTAVDD